MATSRNRYKTQRSAIDANGISQSKEFVQRKDESKRSVDQRANEWQVGMRGKMPSREMSLERAVQIYLEYRKADFDNRLISSDTFKADQTDSINLLVCFGADRDKAKRFIRPDRPEDGGQALGTRSISLVDTYSAEQAALKLIKNPRTAKGMREFGRRLFKWLIARKWAEGNPFLESRPVSYDPEKYEEPMTAEEFEDSLSKVDRQDMKTQFALLRWTGLRPKGIRELLWAEVEERNGRLFIRKQSAKRKSGKQPVYVPEPAASMLRAMPRTSLFVFPSPKTGRPYADTCVGKAWRKVRPNDRGVYDLKHLRVSEISEFGFDDLKTARAVGMKSPQALTNYRQFSPDAIAEEIERSEQGRNTKNGKAG